MFTGIITDKGILLARDDRGETTLTIGTSYPADSIALGASIACNGICLTVTGKTTTPNSFTVQASQETKNKTTLKYWQPNQLLNLERALKLGDELGGHLVTGHVDATATVASITPSGQSHILRFTVPSTLARFIAPKGAVTLNGVSLTVNHVEDTAFDVTIIPHTWEHTSFSTLNAGDSVNIEVDMFARYCARLMERP